MVDDALSLDVIAADPEVTAALARALAAHLRPGDVLCLDGQLGAGKTTFVTALARALGAEDDVVSPTFTLEHRHDLVATRAGAPQQLLHCDLYRPGEDARRDLLPSMLEARDEGAVLAIEWAAPVKDWVTPYLELRLDFEAGAGEGLPPRRIRLRAVPDGWPPLERLRAEWEQLVEGAT